MRRGVAYEIGGVTGCEWHQWQNQPFMVILIVFYFTLICSEFC